MQNHPSKRSLSPRQTDPHSRKNNNYPRTSLLHTRSPLRDRSNMHTPTPKASLSPLRSRNSQSLGVFSSVSSSGGISPSPLGSSNSCQNHPIKRPKFRIYKEGQYFYFCEKCAIPLITNGFDVEKISQTEENPRVVQINSFLKKLQQIKTSLAKKGQATTSVVRKAQESFQQQLDKIEEYYEQFYQIINQHKRRVIEQMRTQSQKTISSASSIQNNFEQAQNIAKCMHQDIVSSMDSVILDVLECDFRSVMNQYNANITNFQEILRIPLPEPIQVRKLSFQDGEPLCQALIDGLVIEWDEVETEKNARSQQEYQNCGSSGVDQRDNLKQLGELFRSYDDECC